MGGIVMETFQKSAEVEVLKWLQLNKLIKKPMTFINLY